MSKIPYLFRRKNIYYFRFSVPIEFRDSLKVREIVQSLKTECRVEAAPLALKLACEVTDILRELKTGKVNFEERELFKTPKQTKKVSQIIFPSSSPKLSTVVDDFLKRYDTENKSMLVKLTATLPILIELVGDKPVNQILQVDINSFFDNVQKLPVRRDAKEFKGMSINQIIAANKGSCIAEKTFKSTYRACISSFLCWAVVHYSDQGFPALSVKGALYRGARLGGINKQRAMKPEELQTLFGHGKMKNFADSPATAHYCWLPLIGLFTGARINEVCQLNPETDIVQDSEMGIYYFHFTDEGESALNVDKSIKTNSSRRIVPIHSKLIELGFLDYVKKVRAGSNKVIFPEWKARGGKASMNAGKWFSRYLTSIGIYDDTEGARITGFHAFRHTFITYAINNKIQGFQTITGHESDNIDGIGKVSDVVKGYYTTALTDNLKEKQEIVERFDFGLEFFKPKV